MKQLFPFFYTLFFVALFFKSSAQGGGFSPNTGFHPQNNWQFIDTENTKIIFPVQNKKQAFRITNIIEKLQKKTPAKKKKINIILLNRGVYSNGFVGLFPFRSVFFHKPRNAFNTAGSVDWIDRLTLHEYRHLYQFLDGYRQNKFARLMSWLWGEWGWGLIFIAAPKFYFEGNAVWYETIFSTSGRGRIAYFFKEQRALLMNDMLYPYQKARNGSYKDIVPNIYQYGYVMNRYLDNVYYKGMMDDIFNHTVQYKNIISPFFKAVKKYTGLNSKGLYQNAYQEMQSNFKTQWKNRPSLPLIKPLAIPPKKTVTDYLFPQPFQNGIIALKKSYATLPKIVHVKKDGSEKKIMAMGLTAESYFHYANGKIVFTQLSKNLRYNDTQYNDIVIYDITAQKRKKISRKKRYFSPRLSGDGRLVCVEQDMSSGQFLTVINVLSKKVLQKIKFSYGVSLSYPQWKTPSKIIYLKRFKNKIAFFTYDLNTEKQTRLSPWTTTPIGAFSLQGDKIYYSASYFGVDDIYCFDIPLQKTTRVSAVKVGAYQPFVRGKECLLSYFTTRGHRLGMLPLSKKGIAFDETTINTDSIYRIKNTENKYFLKDIPDKKYTVKPYRGLFKGFQFYRWGLLLGQANKSIFPFFELYGRDYLQNLSAYFKASYFQKEKTFQYESGFVYNKYFVALSGNFFTRKRSTFGVFSKAATRKNFNTLGYSLSAEIPLKQYYKNYIFNFNTRATVQQLHLSAVKSYDLTTKKTIALPKETHQIFQFKTSLSNQKARAYQNVNTRFGQMFSYHYKKDIRSKNGEFHSVFGALYFPGFSKNHSFNTHFFWKKQSVFNPYQHPESVLFARGYSPSYSQDLQTVQVNYQLPLFYPDWGFKNVFYFKRLRANLFYDQSNFNAAYYKTPQKKSSAGLGFLIDFHLFNLAPFTLGIIPQYLFEKKQLITEFSFNLNLPSP